MNITIEKAGYHELHKVQTIFTESFRGEVNPSHIKRRMSRMRQFYYFLRPFTRISPWAKNLFNIYVIKFNDTIAGFSQVSYINNKEMHIDYIAVRKQYRGQGLGTCALRKLLDEVADVNKLDAVLEVKSGNAAYHLYKRLGFSTQAHILQYGKTFEAACASLVPPLLPGLRLLQDIDRTQLYELYRNIQPKKLQRNIKQDYQRFNPSLFVRNLEWVKNYLMKKIRREFVIEIDKRIVASLEIHSFPKTASHIINVMLHPDHENLRKPLFSYALFLLRKKYKQGKVITTIYNDDIRKQQTLNKLGFSQEKNYHLMVRHPESEHTSLPPKRVAYSERLANSAVKIASKD
ncbi:MAG: GNAT family N-acetyltransferase [Sporomusaceae bacterium]|nr:GNAT family N-acetyltransferase [Sporomusaceae bacterium]